jgi:hypothetical protein
MKRAAGYTLSDYKRNGQIMEELYSINNRLYRKINKKMERSC